MFNLPQSTDSIKSHLCLIHLSKESFTEGELIFARAGLFDVEDSVIAKYGSAQSISTLMGSSGAEVQRASIRHTLVVIPKVLKSRYSVNLQMSKAISMMYGVL